MNEATKAAHLESQANTLPVRGVHHLVLNTDDMKVTIDFYTEVLGMQLLRHAGGDQGSDRGHQ